MICFLVECFFDFVDWVCKNSYFCFYCFGKFNVYMVKFIYIEYIYFVIFFNINVFKGWVGCNICV